MCFKFSASIFKKIMSRGDQKFLRTHKSFGNFSIMKDLPYIDDGDKYHKLDILKPVLGSENGITLFYIHGGAYLYGDKETNQIFTSWYASQGYTVISLNYRLMNIDDVDFKEQMKDIVAALNYVYENRFNFELNLNNLCLMGDSAGGHMSMMLDLIMHYEDIRSYYGVKVAPVNFRCTVLNSTMYDFKALVKYSRRYLTKKGTKNVLSRYCFDDNYMNINSPKYYLEKGYKLIPTMNTTAYHDNFLFQSLSLKRDAEKYGVDVKTYIETSSKKEIGHVFNHFIFDKEGKKCNLAMCDFIKSHCNIE